MPLSTRNIVREINKLQDSKESLTTDFKSLLLITKQLAFRVEMLEKKVSRETVDLTEG